MYVAFIAQPLQGALHGNRDMTREDIEAEIEALLNAKPETGEQWAEICRLEVLAEALKKIEGRK